MQASSLTPVARQLAARLEAAEAPVAASGPFFHVTGMGAGFYFAYEQLRNAAEYREHHLLLRSAIGRYLDRYVRLQGYEPVGADLVAELTQAGYLKNDTVPVATVHQIDELLERYVALVRPLGQAQKVSRAVASGWLFQIASVQIEDLLAPNGRLPVVMAFAYEHYLAAIDRPHEGRLASEEAFQVALYCAVQRAAFKSDVATTRYYCLAASLPALSEQSLGRFGQANRLIDELYQAPETNRLFRLVSRYAAPMRILTELLLEPATTSATLASRTELLAKIKRVCQQQYALMHKRLGVRIFKSILFVFITKVLLGVAVEVPYDVVVEGMIAWRPLLINVTFPVVYMLLMSARITTPGRHNSDLIASFVDRILYEGELTPVHYRPRQRVSSAGLRTAFSVVYTLGFLVSFGLVTWALVKLDFNPVNGLIFFIFLSAVSFLGFRLRQLARELSMLDDRQGLLDALADFLSTPFVRVGNWLSDRYARLNIVTLLLDVAVEMPLKTALRLVRQWVGFMRDKQEEL